MADSSRESRPFAFVETELSIFSFPGMFRAFRRYSGEGHGMILNVCRVTDDRDKGNRIHGPSILTRRIPVDLWHGIC